MTAPSPEAIAEAVERIRAAVEHWGDAGCGGTYVADAVDYGKIDIAVLRDSRTLLAALEAERAAHRDCQDQLDAARGWPWSFVLQPDEDETGVSGTGIVAEGVEFSDHSVALRWISDWPTSVVFHDRGIESVQAVHGHGGKTRIVFTPPLAASTPYRSRLATTEAALEASERENERLREALEEIAVADARNAPWDGATSLNVARTLASMARVALAPSTPKDAP